MRNFETLKEHWRLTIIRISFCELEKEKFKKEAEAEGKQIDLSKTLGEAWKQLSEEDRKPYYDIYNEDKERYSKEMAIYEANKPKKAKAAKVGASNDDKQEKVENSEA